jgi:hypothetical protein
MDPILNKQTEKNTRLLFLVFIVLVWELLDRTVYVVTDRPMGLTDNDIY